MLELSQFDLSTIESLFPPIAPLLRDSTVTEIMIVTRQGPDPVHVFFERRGTVLPHPVHDVNIRQVEALLFSVARPQGEDPNANALIDARLGDGSRVAICVPPATPAPCITIRRFSSNLLTAAWLVDTGALPREVLKTLSSALLNDRNVLVCGGTGSGKTTLLNALLQLFPATARILVVEDTIELKVEHLNTVRLEARNLALSEISHRDLVKHALRHRPDHIVLGEVRGPEAADVLQALNTGHGGSMTTIHANTARDALMRLASCAMQAMGDLPWHIVCQQVASAFDLVVHQARRPDRSRGIQELIRVKSYDTAAMEFVTEVVWAAPAAARADAPSRALVMPAGTPFSVALPRAVWLPPGAVEVGPVVPLLDWPQRSGLVVPADTVPDEGLPPAEAGAA